MARFFSQSTDIIKATSGGPVDTNNFTAFCMYKPVSVTSPSGNSLSVIQYIGFGSGSGGGWGIYMKNDATVRVDIAFVADYNSGLHTILNQWNRIGLTRSSGTWQLWVNGVKSSVTSSSNPFVPNGQYTIGARPNSGASSFDSVAHGAIAEVALWTGDVLSDFLMSALTLGFILPKDLDRSSLEEYNPLKYFQGGTTETYLYHGINLTRTGTQPYQHPDFKPNYSPFYVPSPAAVSVFRFQHLPLLGIG